ncbi:MAG TPA: hypothetical protein VFJ06_04480 [Halococcus sp.]|nr:hypothetical protein [Halococcus sp.]
MVQFHDHYCSHPRTVEGRTVAVEEGVTYEIFKYVFGSFETIRLIAFPTAESVHLCAKTESDTAASLGLCDRQQALMFHPDDGGLEINNQEVVGLKLPLRAFARIQHDIAALLPDDCPLEGTPARLSHAEIDTEATEETDDRNEREPHQ